jgi:hypothetical protein
MIDLFTSGWSINLVECSIEEDILSFKLGMFFDLSGHKVTLWNFHNQSQRITVEIPTEHKGRESEVVIFDGTMKIIRPLLLNSYGQELTQKTAETRS